MFRKPKKSLPSMAPVADPFPDEEGKAFSKNALLNFNDLVSSPDVAFEKLMEGHALIGCTVKDGNFVIPLNVLAMRDEKLFHFSILGDRNLYLMVMESAPDETYKERAYAFYDDHELCFADEDKVIKLENAHFDDIPNLDIKAILR